ncbi:hypothetical protein [Streptomyces sp. NPDC051016]|uniref:hypothetical protein n=1 Tax=Streptomyces sp. NPDC051016 TaxID=3365638 RepID=UPI0037A41A26
MAAEDHFVCPYGGCEPYGYCPCAEHEAELEDLEPDEDFEDFAVVHPRVRPVRELPDISNYRSPQGS